MKSIKSLYDFLKFNFSHFTPQVKILGFSSVMERGISEILIFVILLIASKIFGKMILKPL